MRNISKDDFIIRKTEAGHSVDWALRKKFIKFFSGSDSKRRANVFIQFLVDWYKREGWRIDSEGRFQKGMADRGLIKPA